MNKADIVWTLWALRMNTSPNSYQIYSISRSFKLWIAVAKHIFQWVKIYLGEKGLPFNRRCRIYSGFHFLIAH